MTSARGAALLDTLVASALCVTVSAAAIPVIGGSLDRERTIVGAQYLAGQLQRARLASLTRARSAAVRLEMAGPRAALQLFADGNGNGVLQRDIDRGIDEPLTPREFLDDRSRDVSLRVNQPIVDVGGGPPRGPRAHPLRIGSTSILSFSPLGSATGGTLYVAAPRGPQMAIRVNGATGRIRILTFDAHSRQWR